MRSKPITFTSGNLIKVLNGTKPQTRRLNVKGYVGVEQLWIQEPYRLIKIEGDRLFRCEYGSNLLDCRNIQITENEFKKWEQRKQPLRANSARFMYKSLARHFAPRIEVRVEILNQISDEDCIAEGIEQVGDKFADHSNALWDTPREAFKSLWISINDPLTWEKDTPVAAIDIKELIVDPEWRSLNK